MFCCCNRYQMSRTFHLEKMSSITQNLHTKCGFHFSARCTRCETAFVLPSSCIHEMYLWTDRQEIGHRKTCAASAMRCLEQIQSILGSVHHHIRRGTFPLTSVSLRKTWLVLGGRRWQVCDGFASINRFDNLYVDLVKRMVNSFLVFKRIIYKTIWGLYVWFKCIYMEDVSEYISENVYKIKKNKKIKNNIYIYTFLFSLLFLFILYKCSNLFDYNNLG